ncbi:hypothetical protein E2C01_071101 [Portunus trituberculatus]|uniref:Uncharacterized protein n=1 Tax=Portunus trituberculatus TaxID=210409 RepID=A0A5B7I733_PORTR|nr:hypothetical protein [Portunus trituberculatus]
MTPTPDCRWRPPARMHVLCPDRWPESLPRGVRRGAAGRDRSRLKRSWRCVAAARRLCGRARGGAPATSPHINVTSSYRSHISLTAAPSAHRPAAHPRLMLRRGSV